MEKIVLLCENSIEGMLTAIYEGFVIKNEKFSGKDNSLSEGYQDNIEIRPEENYEYEMFAVCVTIKTDEQKAEKTIGAIRRKLGDTVYHMVLRALCHFDDRRGTEVFGFLVRGFRTGSGVVNMLGDPFVMAVMEFSRKAANEAHYFVEFIRFEERNHILYSKIEPKCNVLPLIGNHFSDRFPNENFIIYDAVRRLTVVHRKYEELFFVRNSETVIPDTGKNELIQEAEDYGQLWKSYFDSIFIEARENKKCQRTMLPLWYRKNMTEFSEKRVDK